MSLFDFKKVPVKTRVIYGFIMATVATLSWYLFSFVFEEDYSLTYYIVTFLLMFIVGFSTIKLRANNNKD